MKEIACVETELLELYAEEGRELLDPRQFEFGKVDEVIERVSALPQADIPILNTIAGGVYTRAMDAPAGSFIIGEVHARDTINILAQGVITIVHIDEKGFAGEPMTFTAPYTYVSEAGTRKIGLVHEDVHFINTFHVERGQELSVKDDSSLRKLISYPYQGGVICQQ